jgi:hypothetical protein
MFGPESLDKAATRKLQLDTRNKIAAAYRGA